MIVSEQQSGRKNKEMRPLKLGWSDSEVKLLWISKNRTRAFVERAVRELMAGGNDKLVMSALGEAISFCIAIAMSLVEKGAVTLEHIEVFCAMFEGNNYSSAARIYIKMVPDLKGSRIPPTYVSCYDGISPLGNLKSLPHNVSWVPLDAKLNIDKESIDGKALLTLLDSININMEGLSNAFKEILAAGLDSKAENDESLRAVVYNKEKHSLPNIKLVIGRPSLYLSKETNDEKCGAAFLVIFRGRTTNPGNIPLGFVATYLPPKNKFKSENMYIQAVERTSTNSFVILCDYNGLVRREGPQMKLQRMMSARLRPITMANNENVPDNEVLAFIRGSDKGYCYGPGPRIIVANYNEIFSRCWKEFSGSSPLEFAETLS